MTRWRRSLMARVVLVMFGWKCFSLERTVVRRGTSEESHVVCFGTEVAFSDECCNTNGRSFELSFCDVCRAETWRIWG